MDERKSRTSSKTLKSTRSKVTSTSFQATCSAGDAKLLRCPDSSLNRLRRLNEAEVITLFTPFVPHSPSTTLEKNMDPFEPLGRALPRKVRHVPFRLDRGLTALHSDFLPSSGAVVLVVCVSDNVISNNARAFGQQLKFARDVWRNIAETESIADIPAILFLVSSDSAGQAYADAMPEFPALVLVNDYTTSALTNAVRVLFGL
ncbi:hypothetical protein BDU57DRAFT_182335 [Ampelomyces quisqualis]|uniref:Uncharacterized protein n=1 Tax=Ampelomyces quisqualis TaxID=50730 RepID=A0A6A5QSW4_AMPQU|nr:hypothetical protein BDU57DRAFT_182335 [Ampelomyces quisqualis]